MTSREMVQAIEAWVAGVIPGILTFDFPPEELVGNLPMVLASIDRTSLSDEDEALPAQAQYQQTLLRLWAVEIVILCTPDPAQDATNWLYDTVDALGGSVRGGARLSDNVVLSQYYEADFNPPEVEYQDGTIARQVTISVVVGETQGA